MTISGVLTVLHARRYASLVPPRSYQTKAAFMNSKGTVLLKGFTLGLQIQ
jgi:hypothetical protein